MEVLAAAVGWVIQIISTHLSAQRASSIDIQNLTARLSSEAQIYQPGSSGFKIAAVRWSSHDVPTFRLVVNPRTENDVAEIVKYDNELDMPFLTITGGHGAITTVGDVHQGIGIWMKSSDSVEIASDGSTVNIGGGALTKSFTAILVCECMSILGPGLEGGHGALQGRIGLVSDQFVSMNVVLANGTLGAGHNFGIVTSVTAKIYDVQTPTWAYTSFIYTGDKVADVFDTINKHFPSGTQPVDILTLVLFVNNFDVDPTRPLVTFYVIQEAPFQAIDPIRMNSGSGTYPDIPSWIGEDNDSPSCQKTGLVNLRFPIDLEQYNTTAIQSAYALFAAPTQEHPQLNNSVFLLEGYTSQAVKAIPSKQSAVPFRQGNYLISPLLIYDPKGPELGEIAAKFGEDLRQILYVGSQRDELHTYDWHGYEQWPQDRLSALKKSCDPLGRFSFYAPIKSG
ncbi:hypothetical protein GGR57DRAFT_489995 [Xylariaceae sp. FL1272]|nr:hypothetical protein GGR57DRAFT_489995 [Xylariaceae sp. FL1272]